MDDRTCAYPGCTNLGEPGVYRRLKYCGDVCRERDKWRKRKPGTREGVSRLPCVVCGEPIGPDPYKPFRGGVKHNRCFEHGTEYGYTKHGCRCPACTDAAVAVARAYRERREAEGRPVTYNRSTVDLECRVCGEVFPCRVDALSRGRGRYCSRRCVVFDQTGVDIGDPDWESLDRFRVSDSFRTAIYRRDGFICWLCGEATEPDVDPSDGRYPSLDHVVPRSRGGADSAENLRCAHRLCNSIKGAREVGDAFLSGVFGVAV